MKTLNELKEMLDRGIAAYTETGAELTEEEVNKLYEKEYAEYCETTDEDDQVSFESFKESDQDTHFVEFEIESREGYEEE